MKREKGGLIEEKEAEVQGKGYGQGAVSWETAKENYKNGRPAHEPSLPLLNSLGY